MMDCFRKTWAREGAKGLYAGAAAPLWGAMAHNAGVFFSYGMSKKVRSSALAWLGLDDDEGGDVGGMGGFVEGGEGRRKEANAAPCTSAGVPPLGDSGCKQVFFHRHGWVSLERYSLFRREVRQTCPLAISFIPFLSSLLSPDIILSPLNFSSDCRRRQGFDDPAVLLGRVSRCHPHLGGGGARGSLQDQASGTGN